MTDKEKTDFGITLKQIVGMFDTMFDKEFPYMMCMHNAPVNSGDVEEDFHFHVEFFHRFVRQTSRNSTLPAKPVHGLTATQDARKEVAAELREAYDRYKNNL